MKTLNLQICKQNLNKIFQYKIIVSFSLFIVDLIIFVVESIIRFVSIILDSQLHLRQIQYCDNRIDHLISQNYY
jgi:hypothetical protein